ncbi:DUF4377 domain-containing protein [Leeuwenhoekiella parthenopeia]|uniref:DUF4377 domain-containing protein n=1 Tax=Leeuwenhoekiella parthenopeia TaxID=2890320 RepID=A0ABS8GUV4_9FLAO|nr:DUF4377 domain-containing protein [Leeuwenhoekiella parthenopeia]MCC4213786.1 DUF4377 domain-containing protein [Leeuwenhoekiella parthenopeia]
MKKILFLTLLCLINYSCSNDVDESEVVSMRVNHYQTTAIGLSPQLVLMVQEGNAIGSSEWSYLYEGISGFDYVAGKTYDLTVKKERITNPPADASTIQYSLIRIQSTEEIDADVSFKLALKINGENFVTGTSQLSILNEIDITCTSFCEELQTKLQDQDFVYGTFKRLGLQNLELISVE